MRPNFESLNLCNDLHSKLRPGLQIITILFGILTTFYLPDSPARSQFLTEEEKFASLHRLILDARGATDEADVNQEKFSWHWVK